MVEATVMVTGKAAVQVDHHGQMEMVLAEVDMEVETEADSGMGLAAEVILVEKVAEKDSATEAVEDQEVREAVALVDQEVHGAEVAAVASETAEVVVILGESGYPLHRGRPVVQ